MKIGIDASRAFIKDRTGIEEYSFQVINHLMDKITEQEVSLYIKGNQKKKLECLNMPSNWQVKVIKWPFLWTHIGLSMELLFHPVDILFIPAHIIPLIFPKKTVVTVHGLEYEFCPEAYSFWAKSYMRWAIRRSCRKASWIISVSENTKGDLIKLYNVPKDKIRVIYEGTANKYQAPKSNIQKNTKFRVPNYKYIIFIGRLERRKNIAGIIEAFEILKEKYQIKHNLMLVGKPGHGYEDIKNKIYNSKFKSEIIETGFVDEEEKNKLLKSADLFLFPTFYEGFGLPILEAQNLEIPVVTSNVSSLPEISGDSALKVNPFDSHEIADAVLRILNDDELRKSLIERGKLNCRRFSWDGCASSIADLLIQKISGKVIYNNK